MTREEFIKFLTDNGFIFRPATSYEYSVTGNWDNRYVYYFDDGCIVIFINKACSVEICLYDFNGMDGDETTIQGIKRTAIKFFKTLKSAYNYLTKE